MRSGLRREQSGEPARQTQQAPGLTARQLECPKPPSGVFIKMAQRLPIYASRSEEIIAYARVDDDDYAHLAAYR